MRKVLITGGSGSLGRALLDYNIDEMLNWDITVYSRDEVKQGEMRGDYPDVRFVLGDVCDTDTLKIAMRNQEVVIHAAAYKQVPAVEVNASVAIDTNVIGSRNVAMTAIEAGVERVVGISTDKACAPINCYGETKALMEKLFMQACLWGDTQFNLVRYGNVLGSRGSVLPLFKKQIAQGYVTITDPRMTRFWLTLDDAIELVLTAMDDGVAGSVIVPLAPASTMDVLACAAIETYAYNGIVNNNIALTSEGRHRIGPEIRTIGVRPGEKMHEQMIHAGEAMHTEHVKIGTLPDGTTAHEYFRVHPAYSGFKGNLLAGYEYRSDTARQLNVGELVEMLKCSE